MTEYDIDANYNEYNNDDDDGAVTAADDNVDGADDDDVYVVYYCQDILCFAFLITLVSLEILKVSMAMVLTYFLGIFGTEHRIELNKNT